MFVNYKKFELMLTRHAKA